MNCPFCIELMNNRDEIHQLGEGRQRMNLHCWKRKLGDHQSHMGVIVNSPSPWECLEYNFSFIHEKKRYFLTGRRYAYKFDSRVFPGESTTLSEGWNSQNGISIPFVPLSTGDDLPETFWALFEKMKLLSTFS